MVSYDSYVHLPRQPYLQMQTQNSILVKWQTLEDEVGCVRYGEKKLEKKVCELEATNVHRIRLDNLKKSTEYVYAVDSASLQIDNEGRHFKTLFDDANRSQKIWIIGDSGQPGAGQDAVLKSMQESIGAENLDLWLLLGDNAYRSGSQKQYNAGLFEPYAALLKSLVPWAVIGNHDARRWAFYDIFEFPTGAESGGVASGRETFYALEQGNLHIVMIDSETEDLSKDGTLAQWLEKDLQESTKPWSIAVFHHPPYTKGGHNSDNPHDSHYKLSGTGRLFLMRENIIPILEKYGVDVVYSGHSHDYERSKLLHQHYGDSSTFAPDQHVLDDHDTVYCKTEEKKPFDGTVYTVIGSSSKLDRAALKHPALPFSFERMGSVVLDVNTQRLRSEFLSDTGEVLDFFELYRGNSCPK